MQTTSGQLRTRTRAIHQRLQSAHVVAPDPGPGALWLYVAWLRSLSLVVGAAEHLAGRSTAPEVSTTWTPAMAALPHLEADIDALRHEGRGAVTGVEAAVSLVVEMRGWTDPTRLLGALYALHGSLRGAPALAERVADALGLDGPEGRRHLTADADRRRDDLDAFLRRVDGLALDQSGVERAAEGATTVLQGILDIAEALQHERSRRSLAVRALNPDAGHHAVTIRPRELMSALDAGEQTWEAWPYMAARYGEKGRRFTRSDSGWLVTLVGQGDEAAAADVDWLAAVLAARGMPSRILAEHLDTLHDHLIEAHPDGGSRYGLLQREAGRLRRRAADAITADQRDSLARALDAAGDGPRPDLRARDLLLSAAADEHGGARGAVAAVAGWLADTAEEAGDETWAGAVRLFAEPFGTPPETPHRTASATGAEGDAAPATRTDP